MPRNIENDLKLMKYLIALLACALAILPEKALPADGCRESSSHAPGSALQAERETLPKNRDKKGKTYTNPVRTTDGKPLAVADPFVYSHNGVYYLTGTTGDAGFAYYTSTDLLTWKYGGLLYRIPEGHAGDSSFWAPEVKQYAGKFYLTYSCAMPERGRMLTCMAVSDSPEGPFRDLYVPWFDFGYAAIDGHIFVDDDGTPYLYYSKNGSIDGKVATGEIYVVRLAPDLSKPEGTPVYVSGASQPWEKVNWEANRCNEGPEVFKRNGVYYMTYSANDTGYGHYGVGISQAAHPLGPWTKCKDNPLMTTDLSRGVSSPGHNSLVVAPDGELYIVYHRHADPRCEKPNWDRVVCIDRLYFDRKGRVRTKGPSSTPQPIGW